MPTTQTGLSDLPAADQAALKQYAGQKLTTGPQAKAYANHYIAVHLKRHRWARPTPRSAASTSSSAPPTRRLPPPRRAPTSAGLRQTMFMGETLRGLLLYGYAFATMGTIAGIAAIAAFVGAALMFLLAGIGFWHSRRAGKDRGRRELSRWARPPDSCGPPKAGVPHGAPAFGRPGSGVCLAAPRPDQVVHADRDRDARRSRSLRSPRDRRAREYASTLCPVSELKKTAPISGLADREADPLAGLQHAAGGAAHRRVDVHQRQRLVGRDQQRPGRSPSRTGDGASASVACPSGTCARHDGQRDRARAPNVTAPATTSGRPIRVTTRPARGAETALPTAYAVTPSADSSAV